MDMTRGPRHTPRYDRCEKVWWRISNGGSRRGIVRGRPSSDHEAQCRRCWKRPSPGSCGTMPDSARWRFRVPSDSSTGSTSWSGRWRISSTKNRLTPPRRCAWKIWSSNPTRMGRGIAPLFTETDSEAAAGLGGRTMRLLPGQCDEMDDAAEHRTSGNGGDGCPLDRQGQEEYR